jgi:hypothetical protein
MIPIIASYHISQTDHLAFNFTIWAPTEEYDPNRLANLSTNTWTFIPGVAYTKIFPKPNIELSAAWSLQFGQGRQFDHSVDRKEVAKGRIEKTAPFVFSQEEGLDVSEDSGTPVNLNYDVPFKFTGKLDRVTIVLK